jgi:ELWxxDGT repeat protein
MDIRPLLQSSDPADLTVVNNRVFFNADDGVNGRELWVSDGTLGGTFLVRDIRPGTCTSTPCSSAPANLRDVGGILYFTADDGLNGRELWQSDGTASGTVLVQDIAPGAAASNPADITSLATRQGTYTFFTANDGNTGMELWLIPPAPTPPTAFYTVTPCRLVDTRDAPAPLGGPALVAWTDRSFVLVLARPECNIPLTASAVSLNIAVTQPAGAGNLRVLPTGGLMSTVSAINYAAGQTRANNAVVALGYGGAVTVRPSQSTGTTHFILDVNGYFE